MKTNLRFFSLLSPEDLQQIDQAGRRILQHVGMRILDAQVLKRLEKTGAEVDHENGRVRFEGVWLDEILRNAPSSFILHSRDGRNDIRLGQGRVYFANGGRVFRILDTESGSHRPTRLEDVAQTAALVDQLGHIDFYIIACQAHDLKKDDYHLNDFYRAFKHTAKHVMGGCDDLEGAKQMFELAAFIAGGPDRLSESPFVSIITNPISPLTVDPHTLRILQFLCARGIPVTCAPAPISGATSPATLAGTLSQMHAEALAGAALTQVFCPGARVLYGAVPTAMDLRNMEYTMGSVEMGMMNAAAVQLAKLYDLPIYASAGVTEAKSPDIQTGFEKSLTNLLVAMSGADCIHLAAGLLDSGNSISYEQFAIDNEILGTIRRILAGIEVNEATLGLEVIEKVGPGSHYVLEDHTVEHMMEEFFYPDLSVRLNFDVWEQKGRPSMLSRARNHVSEILQQGKKGTLDSSMVTRIGKCFPGIKDP
jgi:trimethylamine--corrinoid protein Co-methyltransferase